MKAWHFSETAYPYLPDDIESVRITLPNRVFDPAKGADLWDRYIEEWKVAEQSGLGIMLNEHHSTATCMDPAAPIIAGILARETTTAPIMILGNPVANRKDPVRVAEEMALIDVLSRGRLIVGLVRGVPWEVSATNSYPLRMQERLWEAHDLILKAWTTHDGPFSWSGEFFHHREVNIFPRPWQQPQPPIWVTATSPGSVVGVAERGHTVATFLTGYDGTRKIFDIYRKKAAECGHEVTPDKLAYAGLVYTGETDEEGRAGAEKLLWYISANKVPGHFSTPPGYLPQAARVLAMQGHSSPLDHKGRSLDELIDRGVVFAGSPDTVHEQITRFHERVGGFGHMLNMGQAGFLDHEETGKGIRIFGQEVLPRIAKLNDAPAERTASLV